MAQKASLSLFLGDYSSGTDVVQPIILLCAAKYSV